MALAVPQESLKNNPFTEVYSQKSEAPVHPLQEEKRAVLVSLFVVVNVLLFKFIVSLDAFGSVRYDLQILFGVLFGVLSLALLYFGVQSTFRDAFDGILSRTVTKEVCLSAGLLLAVLHLLYSFVVNFEEYSQGLVYEAFIAIAFVVALDRFVEKSFFREIMPLAKFDLIQMISRARSLREATPESGDVTRKSSGEGIVRYRLQGSKTAWRQAAALQPGDIYEVNVGDLIPCDSVVLSGHCELRERTLSGLSTSRFKSVGGDIFAGSLVMSGTLTCKALCSLEDSRVMSFAGHVNDTIVQSEKEYQSLSSFAPIGNILLIFAAVCAGVYGYKDGASAEMVVAAVVSMLLVTLLPRLISLLPLYRSLVISRFFFAGAIVRDCSIVDALESLKVLVVDYISSDPPGQIKAVAFEVIDDRVDYDALISILISLCGGGNGELDVAATNYLRTLVEKPEFYQVSEFRSYIGKGVSGVVKGVELSVGSEDFLIERGVHLQSSEIVESTPGEKVLYVAVDAEVVARLRVISGFLSDGKEMISRFRKLGVRVVIASESLKEELDRIGKAVDLELADVKGCESVAECIERLTPLKPFMIYGTSGIAPEVARCADLRVAVFNELTWDVKNSDITVFSRDMTVVSSLFELIRKYRRVKIVNIAFVAFLTPLLIGLSFFGVIPPVMVAVTVMVASLFLYLNSWRLVVE